MADTDLPNGFGAIKPAPKPRPRPIASPFGIFPDPWQTPNPSQTPGFNVQPDPASTNPMSSLLASFMPSGQDLKRGVANTLGAPVDALAWATHRMGLPISDDVSYGGSNLGNTGTNRQPTWAPAPNVLFSSQNILGMMNNPPS